MKPETGRRLIHVSTALVLLVHLVWPEVFRPFVWLVAAVALVLDGVRLVDPDFRVWITNLVPVFRTKEAHRPSGASLLWVGYAVAAFFPIGPASVGILAASLGDPAASIVGSRWGREKERKNVIGSAACWAVIVAVALVAGLGPGSAILVAAAGSFLEHFSGPLDDNLLIAPGVTGVAWFLT